MVVNLIKDKQMFSLTLPNRVKGQYWLSDLDDKKAPRQLISIEADKNTWVIKSNNKVRINDGQGNYIDSFILSNSTFLYLEISDSKEKVILFTESEDNSRQVLTKISAIEGAIFSIGRNDNNNFIYSNSYVSGEHAQLSFDGENWSITDKNSKNGTYVNGYRIENKKLSPGDFIYIMGLKIVIGNNFIAVNNPDEKLKIKSGALKVYSGQKRNSDIADVEIPEKQYFTRSPRFKREIYHEVITIDAPPPLQKIDTVPLALMLGPSITMGMTSVSTGILAVSNTISNGGNIAQAIPTLVMSISMLLGTILWPILTKKYEKKEKIKAEQKRQSKYIAYLSEIGDLVKEKSDEQSKILAENLTDLNDCAERIVRKKSNLWERVIGQNDFLRLRLGLGNLPMDAEIKYQEKKFTMDDDSLQNAMLSLAEEPKELANVPISVSLVDNLAVGIYGDTSLSDNLVKSLILQMIALHSYDELKIMLITDEGSEQEWQFVKYIPHFWNNERTIRFFASTADEAKSLSANIEKLILTREDKNNKEYSDYSPYYVIIATSTKLIRKCEAIRSLLKYKNNVGFSLLITDEKFDAFPKETKTIIHLTDGKSEIFDKDDTTGQKIQFVSEKSNNELFERISSKIANIELDLNSQKYSLPTMVTFLEMFNVGKVEHLNSLVRWKENNPTQTLQTPVGFDVDGDLFNLDLHEKFHGPHGLIAGMTGSGKSEFIITFILSLAVNYHPDEVSFILIDYKGGGLTGAFEDTERGIRLPHLAGTITNLDGASIKRSLTSIQSELRRRQALFNEARKISNEGTMDIYKYQQLYRDRIVSEPLPHLFIISDEFAELKMQQPEFMQQLISTARIGRSLGVHLILATQKPNGVVDDQIWSNSKFRVCLKVQDKSDSQDMIKCPDAAELSQTGRFYLQVGFNEFFALGQSAWCGAEYIPSDLVEKPIDTSVQVIDNLGRTIMSIKQQTQIFNKEKRTKQIVEIVKYLSELALEENISEKKLWLEPIPDIIFVDEIEEKYNITESEYFLNPVVGECDDPFNQKQFALTIPLSSDGNCLVYGATGNGKTTFLTTLCYSLIKHHDAKSLNMYILDFGSETLKAFEKAPQVGDVITSNDEEKINNFLKMLKLEIERRKDLFAPFGGDYLSYAKVAEKHVPNIVVVLNNFSGFSEQYEELLEDFTIITRDSVKYGIYFVVSANSTNAVRYKLQQNFKTMLTMQLNDATDYSLIVGKTDGLVPAKIKGRGLVALEKPYEFQTAYSFDAEDISNAIRKYCEKLSNESNQFANSIPVLPDKVTLEFLEKHIKSLKDVPVGIVKENLEIAKINISNKVIVPIVSNEISDCTDSVYAFYHVLERCSTTKMYDVTDNDFGTKTNEPEKVVIQMFEEMVKRNNTYKDANLNETVLEQFDECVFVILGFKKFYDLLSADGKDKLNTLLEKAEANYKLHFVLCDSVQKFNTFNYEEWFKRHIAKGEGIWFGDGIADQYLLKVNKITNNLYDEIGLDYGYNIQNGRPILIKAITTDEVDK